MYINMNHPINITNFGRLQISNGQSKIQNLTAHSLIYLLSGTYTIWMDNQTYSAIPGDILIIPANTSYRWVSSHHALVYFFRFSAHEITSQEAKYSLDYESKPEINRFAYTFFKTNPIITLRTLTHCESNISVKNIIKKISLLNIWQNNFEKLLVDSLIHELIVTISIEISPKDNLNIKLKEILKYIDANYSMPLTLSCLADRFDLSVSYIARLFKNELQTTSVDYINSVRISAACDLLLNTNHSIAEISEKVGFNNQHYFTIVFKKLYKMTPSQFRCSNLLIC